MNGFAVAPAGEGATPEPENHDRRAECMDRWQHYWKWIWVDGEMTSRQHCSTCGSERDTAEGLGQ